MPDFVQFKKPAIQGLQLAITSIFSTTDYRSYAVILKYHEKKWAHAHNLCGFEKKRKKESKLYKFMTKMSNKNEFIFLCLLLHFDDHKFIPKIGGTEYSFMCLCFVYFCDVVGIIYCVRFEFRRCFDQTKTMM